MRYIFLLFLSILWLPHGSAQVDLSESKEVAARNQKIFIHTDRDFYTAGGSIYFKIYLSNIDGTLSERAHENLYVDLIDATGSISQTTLVKVTNGTAYGAIDLDGNIVNGLYKLRAYTDLTKDDPTLHYLKTIVINGISPDERRSDIANDTVYIALLAEGGNALDQTTGKLGIHATDYFGNPVRMNGELPGQNLRFETNEAGLCAINVPWSKSKKYTIESGLTNPLKYAFPKVQNSGLMLRVTDIGKELEIVIKASNEISGIEFIVSQHDIVIDNIQVKGLDWQHTLSKENLPAGVLQLTLISHDGTPFAERLVFNGYGVNDYNLDLDLEPDEESFNPEEEVNVFLDLYNNEGEALAGNFSASIVDGNIVRPFANNPNINAHYLLTSNLNGSIFRPNDYFVEDGKLDGDKIDLLLLTYGWRTFKKLKTRSTNEKGFNLSGTITKKNNPDKGVKAKGYLSILKKDFSLLPFETDEDGRFELKEFEFYGKTDVFIQAEIDNKKSIQKYSKKLQRKFSRQADVEKIELSGNRNVDIILNKRYSPTLNFFEIEDLSNYYSLPTVARLRDAESIIMSEEDLDIQMNIDLEGVTLTGQRIDKAIEAYKPTMFYSAPDNRIRVSEITQAVIYEDIYNILVGRIPGLILDGPDKNNGAKHRVVLRNYSAGGVLTTDAAKFYVNGTFASQLFVETLRPADIEFIDVVKSLYSLTGYGEAGANGIIFIYLKSPEFREQTQPKTYNGILNTVIAGYNTPREFYVPKINPENNNKRQVTIHWEPNIVVDKNGLTSFSFNTSKIATTYDVLIQGLTEDGLPVVKKAKIQIK